MTTFDMTTLIFSSGGCPSYPFSEKNKGGWKTQGRGKHTIKLGRREKTPTPKTRVSTWTLLRTPGRFTTRPLPVQFTTKMSVVRPFSVLSKDEIGP